MTVSKREFESQLRDQSHRNGHQRETENSTNGHAPSTRRGSLAGECVFFSFVSRFPAASFGFVSSVFFFHSPILSDVHLGGVPAYLSGGS